MPAAGLGAGRARSASAAAAVQAKQPAVALGGEVEGQALVARAIGRRGAVGARLLVLGVGVGAAGTAARRGAGQRAQIAGIGEGGGTIGGAVHRSCEAQA